MSLTCNNRCATPTITTTSQDTCRTGVGYNGNDAKIQTGVPDLESCKRFCTEAPNPTPYFGFLESKLRCFCKTREDPGARVELRGEWSGYVSGTISCVLPGVEEEY